MVSSSVILLPLYIYPSSNAWLPLYNSLAANPNVTVQAVINPNNGPGPPPYPNSDYITGIAKLNTYANLVPICYVHTSYAARNISDIETDINTCAGWAQYSSADIHVSGVFFDESVAVYNSSTAAYMTTITNYARKALNTSKRNATIIFNTGVPVNAGFYSIADYINVFENSYSAYTAATITNIAANLRAKSAFIIHDYTGLKTAQNLLAAQIVSGGIGGLFITTLSVYSSFSSLWAQFSLSMSAAIA